MTVRLVKGDDEVLVAEAVRAQVAELVGTADSLLVVEELDEDRYRTDDGFEIAPLVDAAQTPPFLTDHRVVVGRHLGRFTKADDVAPLAAYLADPLPSTHLVLVWERGHQPRQDRLGAVPKSLATAIEAAGGEIVTASVPGGKAASKWLDERLAASPVELTAGARRHIADVLGEDRSRVVGLLEVLEATYGPGSRLDVADVEPFCGEDGGVAPWELTDAIAERDVAGALDKLHRMLGAGGRHPLQVMATLHTTYARLLRLDGAGVHDEKAAAQLLGMKGSTFPAKKALAQCQRMGGDRIGTAIELLAEADQQLRGAVAWPDELVMEVLVARLARL